jgi:hypothetical protein
VEMMNLLLSDDAETISNSAELTGIKEPVRRQRYDARVPWQTAGSPL